MTEPSDLHGVGSHRWGGSLSVGTVSFGGSEQNVRNIRCLAGPISQSWRMDATKKSSDGQHKLIEFNQRLDGQARSNGWGDLARGFYVENDLSFRQRSSAF